MNTALADRPASAVGRNTSPRGLVSALRRPDWPLTVLLAGFPLWWILGLSAILPLVMTLPMAVHLWRHQRIRLPRGMGWWLLLLVWVAASVFVLWADAPGAVPDGGLERLLVYGYRLAWYLACTVVLLWVGNARERDVPSLQVVRLLSWMFVITVAGGLLGMAAPRLEFTSLVEAVLPQALSSNGFIQSIVHPAAANLTTFLGHEEYRPIAPFAFANSWGSNLSMFLPFFLLACFGKDAGWRRVLGPVVLVASVAPIVYSMNRGLWASLGAGVLVLLVYLVLKGRLRSLLAVGMAVGLAAVLFGLSPLAEVSGERLENAHSNDRREQLLTQTVISAAEGSPIVGFGSTRDVQGSFASIAGGGTPDCPACAVPPLGTQGHLWLVIFSQGLVGAGLFLLFFLTQVRNHWRCRSPLELAGITLLIFFGLQMFIYDTLGMPLYTVMIGIALMWRQQRSRLTAGPDTDRDLGRMLMAGKHSAAVFLVFTLAGAAVGTGLALSKPAVYSGQVSLLLAPSPLYLSTAGEGSDVRSFTVDTEAALVLSDRSLGLVNQRLPVADAEVLRSRIQITAAPNTRVLHITYLDSNKDQAEEVVSELAGAYLEVRNGYLAQRREQVLHNLQDQLTNLTATGADTAVPTDLQGSDFETTAAGRLRAAINELTISSTEAGEVIRSGEAVRTRGQPEVPVVSGALLGFLLALPFVILRTYLSKASPAAGLRPARRRSAGRRTSISPRPPQQKEPIRERP